MTRPVRACVSPGRAERRPAGARVGHLRTRGGEHEADLIVEHGEHSVVAVEVKLGPAPSDRDARHLNWLAQGLGSRLIDRVIINTRMFAYRRAPSGRWLRPRRATHALPRAARCRSESRRRT